MPSLNWNLSFSHDYSGVQADDSDQSNSSHDFQRHTLWTWCISADAGLDLWLRQGELDFSAVI